MTNREISYVKFLSLYNSGMNDVEIGKALGLTKYRIRTFRNKLEFPPNKPRKYNFTEEMDERIKKMHEDGCTIKVIAEEFETEDEQYKHLDNIMNEINDYFEILVDEMVKN